MKLWLTSDSHYNHTNIIKYCDRPFVDVSHMNWTLVNNWNSVVEPNDWVIHCGDVAMGRWEDSRSVVRALLGNVVLLAGNHDRNKFLNVYRDLGWHVLQSLSVEGVLFQHHYISSDVEHDHDLVVHGHSHGTVIKDRHVDVGVDDARWIKFTPINAINVIGGRRSALIVHVLNTMFEKGKFEHE